MSIAKLDGGMADPLIRYCLPYNYLPNDGKIAVEGEGDIGLYVVRGSELVKA